LKQSRCGVRFYGSPSGPGQWTGLWHEFGLLRAGEAPAAGAAFLAAAPSRPDAALKGEGELLELKGFRATMEVDAVAGIAE